MSEHRIPETCDICGRAMGDGGCVIIGGVYCIRRGYERLQRLVETKDAELAERNARLLYLEGLLDTPHTEAFLTGVRLEAAHQILRWGTAHDAGKAPADWFWLLGFLSGKALAAAVAGNTDKAKHHVISSGALLLNWFRHVTGDSSEMRPGIESPEVAP